MWAPVFASVDDLKSEFWVWWRSLQPTERLREDGGFERQGDFEWGGMRDHAGRNGIVQVMLVLMWWGCALKFGDAEAAERVLDWELAVDKVRWTLRNMVLKGGLSK
jgi:hypothetical protein